MTRAQQITCFLADHGYDGAEQLPLAGDASFRRYIRVRHAGRNYMLMDAPPSHEDVRPFVAIAEHLHASGYSTPAIVARDAESGFLLLEDLGDDTFSTVLRRTPPADSAATERALYEAAIDVLVDWHRKGAAASDATKLPLPLYDEALLMREVALFSDWFLPQVVGQAKAAQQREEYLSLWRDIVRAAPLATDQFVHRDYHADNMMWLPARAGVQRVGLLDFQDGVHGDNAYDLVSLLEDARRDVPAALVEALYARYVAASGVDAGRFATCYAVLGAQRNSKIVGIFTRLAVRDGKAHYLNFLPRVWGHLERDLDHPALATLRAFIDRHVPASQRGVLAIAEDACSRVLSA